MATWQPFEDGHTIGRTGNEGGSILQDEEHLAGARITLEKDTTLAPYAITCGVYGWMVHTRFLADEETAEHAYAEMRRALVDILAHLLADNETADADDDDDQKLEAMNAAIEAFQKQFP
ncbi:MAG: hypothetical protein H7175_20205 [Burkholderiales bacterium]|nr:hypothetical protein [Anaerolineae bacterium]